MKNFSGLHFVCGAFAKLEIYGQKRLFEDHFQIEVIIGDKKDNYDLRDLLRFDFVEWALKGQHLQGDEFGAGIEKQLSMHTIYEDALATIDCSTDDTVVVYENLIDQQLQESENYEFFENPCDPAEAIELLIPFSHEIIHIMCQLTSGWCTDSKIFLNDDIVINILKAFAYLLVNINKQVDIFMKKNGVPLHMRIKTIDLFCINFVYHLDKNGLLSKYRLLLARTNNRLNEKDNAIATEFNKTGKTLMSYVHLLEIEMDGEHVNKLFLCAGSRYFAYEPHNQEKCKVIVLKHENDIQEQSEKLDLVKEFNTINKAMENRRLDILLPFFNGLPLDPYSRPKEFPSIYFVQAFYCYIDILAILTELREVYIYNLLPYHKTLPEAKERGEFLDSLFVTMVEAVLKKVEKLSSLFIQGFDEFPPELIPRLQEIRLQKFGVMGFCGKVDYLMIHRLFGQECPLRKSICHFIGHSRAVQLFFQITKKAELAEATIYNRLYGANDALSDADTLYAEHIKKYFVDERLHSAVIVKHPLSIGTVYYLEPVILTKRLVMQAVRDNVDLCGLFLENTANIDVSEFLPASLIEHLVIRLEIGVGVTRNFIITALKNIPTFNKIEVIVNSDMWKFLETVNLNTMRNCNRELCLILNVDSRMLLCRRKNRFRTDSASDIYKVFKSLIVANEQNIKLHVRVRRMESIKVDTDYARNKFIEFCKREYSCSDETAFSKLSFEEVPYDVGNESALSSVHL
ncbi:hypothetical protein ENBRE01_1649 [Enteropsectra breve]|nr:hypothetical protein ENBRE01_0420 [Enteropsectra breve]KAI5150153.1 hypothetical protein ENBRE01_1331 [Enteropsectra breve]KAI5150691.1 hypothetical protein ENBRE01_1649 [Enteropsectra breve]